MFRLFLAFTVFLNIQIHQVNTLTLLSFLEFLNFNAVRHSQMTNYLSAIKAKFICLGLPQKIFQDHRLKYYFKSVQMVAPMSLKLQTIIDIPTLKKIAQHCDYTYMGQIFKAVYLTSFFSFLRISNLCPHTVADFSPLKHLTGQDLINTTDSMAILVKWSKTMQLNNCVKILHLPTLKNDICPVTAIKNAMLLSPQPRNSALFK